MRDIIMLATIVAFFALCVAYVWWCDRIIGPDQAELTDAAELDVPGAEAEAAEMMR